MKKQFLIFYTFFAFQTVINAQNIQYLPLYDNSTFTRAVNMTSNVPVGKTAGAVDVSGSGGASYAIPIAVPPGTKGIVPSVAIGYNSQGGNGMMGMGWNVSASSAITRVGKNFAYDGVVTSVNLDYADLFALDGNRLELVTGSSYGQYGSTYATKMESFSKITRTSTGNFLVEAKNGMSYEYGNTTDAQFKTDDGANIIAWYLNKTYDQYGNYIEYAYEKIGREIRIKEIRYTGNTAASIVPYNKVQFSYLDRADKRTLYASGASIASNSLLSEITVTTTSDANANTILPVRRYKFNYAKDELNHSFLQEVIEYGSNATDLPLNSTIFKYKKPSLVMSKTPYLTLDAGYEIGGIGDYNGDGLSDVLAVWYVYPNGVKQLNKIKTYLKNPTSNGYKDVPVSLPGGGVFTLNVAYANGDAFAEPPQGQDFDGDGRDDIIVYSGSASNPKGIDYDIYSLKSDDASYERWTGIPPVFSRTGSLTYTGAEGTFSHVNLQSQYATVGDFDGDGLTDILTLLKDPNTDAAKLVMIKPYKTRKFDPNNPITEAQRSCLVESYFSGSTPSSLLGATNIDADGKQELILRFRNSFGSDKRQVTGIRPSSAGTVATPKFQFESLPFDRTYEPKDGNFKIGDFNGDGNMDIVYKTSSNTLLYELSNGKSYVGSTGLSVSNDIQDWDVGDFNGDGLNDIVCAYKKCTYYYPYPQCSTRPEGCGTGNNCTLYFEIFYSTGNGFTKYSYSDAYYDSSAGNNNAGNLAIGDFNGDGKTDILASTISSYNIYSFNPSGNDFLLEKVQDGFMQTTQINYKSLAESGSTYKRPGNETSSYPLNITQAAIKVVTSVTTPDGIGGTTTTNYAYENARLHRSGLGFLGFGKVTVENPIQNAQLITETGILTPQYLPAVSCVTSNQVVNGVVKQLSKTTNKNSVSTNGTRYWMKVDETETLNSLTGAKSKSTSTYDANGNIIFTSSDVNKEEYTYVWYNLTNEGFNAFGSPYFVYSYKERVGKERIYKQARNTYNAKGDVLTSIDYDYDPNTGFQITATTTNTYFPTTGSLNTTTISSPSLVSKTNILEYDTKHRYTTKMTNPLGQVATKTYDPRWGAILSETDITNLTTEYTYDGFGRVKTTKTPQGHIISTNYLWSYEGTLLPTRCYEIVTTTPSKPTTWNIYDASGRMTIGTTENYGNFVNGSRVTTYTYTVTNYDAKGNVAQKSTPTNASHWSEVQYTDFKYDYQNRLTSEKNALIGETKYEFPDDATGKLIVKMTRVTSTGNQLSSKITDATGKVISTTDYGGTLTFDYDSRGNQTAVKLGGVVISSMTYDFRGKQKTLTDKNAGTTEYTYNAYGELTYQKDANGNQYTMLYDILGRLTTRTGPEGITKNDYVTSGFGLNAIKKITSFNGMLQEYIYDNFNRVTTATETIDDVAYSKTFTYRKFNGLETGDIATTKYPSGLIITNEYSNNGYMVKVTNNDNLALFDGTSGDMNGAGKWKTYMLGNKLKSTITYNNFYMPLNYLAQNPSTLVKRQELTLDWDLLTGNLKTRVDFVKNKKESFLYDDLNRLKTATVAGLASMSFDYFDNGNIKEKADAGTYSYDPTRIHAVTGVTNVKNVIPTFQQDITYTKFLRPEKLTEITATGTYELNYTYASDYERRKSVLKLGNTVVDTRLYLGDYDIDTRGSTTRFIHYIRGGDGICSIVVKEGTSGVLKYYFPYTDHLGSILTVTDDQGGVVAEQNFDAWGRRRNVSTWDYANVGAVPVWLYRGYTGHEQLDEFGLINMNARLYDPVLGRMLSSDNLVSDGGSQAFNRYSYANNNPLKFTDPSGNFLIEAVIIGAVLGGGINAAIQGVAGKINSTKDFWKAFGQGALHGAMIGAGAEAVNLAFYGQLVTGIASSYLPSVNLGDETFQLSISPAFVFGTSGFGIGLNVSGSIKTGLGSLGISYGLTGYAKHRITNKSFFEQRLGYGASFGGSDFNLRFGSSTFWGGGIGQTTGSLGVGGKNWSVTYENDEQFELVPADGGDRFRTTGVRIEAGEARFGFNLFTGDPGPAGFRRSDAIPNDGRTGYVAHDGFDPDKYRLGAMYLGYKDYRLGVNSERVRNFWQNQVAHKDGKAFPIFRVMNNNVQPYVTFQTKNPFTTW
jgi:RHS repeat-associated protein